MFAVIVTAVPLGMGEAWLTSRDPPLDIPRFGNMCC